MEVQNIRDLLKHLRDHVEVKYLLIIALSVLVFWMLAELADEVLEGSTRDLDRDILLLLRVPGDLSDPLGPPIIEEIGRDLTALGGVIVITVATLVAAGFFDSPAGPVSCLFIDGCRRRHPNLELCQADVCAAAARIGAARINCAYGKLSLRPLDDGGRRVHHAGRSYCEGAT